MKKAIKILSFIFCLLLCAWFFHLTYERQIVDVELSVRKDLQKSVTKIRDDIQRTTDILYSLSYLLSTFDDVSKEEFLKFTKAHHSGRGAILMVEWQPKVLKKDRDSFILKAKKLTQDESFMIFEPDKDNKKISAKNRDVHFPVLFTLTTGRMKPAIGLDLAWSKERMNSKYQARDQGSPMASNVFDVVTSDMSKEQVPGFAITLPVYKEGVIPKTISKRKENLIGFLASVIYLNNLVEPVAKKLKDKDLYIKIVDSADGTIIFDNTDGIKKRTSQERSVDIYGQKWNVSIVSGTQFFNQYFGFSNFIFPLALLGLLIILFSLFHRSEENNKNLLKTKEDLRMALAEAKSASVSKMRFLANMSHEIRTPMNAILGYANLVKDETDEKMRSTYIQKMIKSGEHLLSIIADILDVSSQEESKLKLHPHDFNLQELLNDVGDIILSKYSNEKVSFSHSLESDVIDLYGDSVRLRQILINLLNNSFKFTEEGTIELTCKLDRREDVHYFFEFVVKDSGVGMDEGFIRKAYKPFSQEDETSSREKGGVGLGLSIVYNIVKLMNGSIDIKSTKSDGTTFQIILPLEGSKTEEKESAHSSSASSTQIEAKKRVSVLIAEDDEDAMFLLKIYLKNQNLDIDYVSNGKDLVDKFKTKKYDLVLTDIQMPKQDGLSATREIRMFNREVPIIIMSAHALPEEREKGFESGASDFVTKPIKKEVLLEIIAKWI